MKPDGYGPIRDRRWVGSCRVDFTATSGTITFAPGDHPYGLLPFINDTTAENPETFTFNLLNPDKAIIADGQGTVTISDNDATKFFVVNDGSPDRTYEYRRRAGPWRLPLNSGNTAPRELPARRPAPPRVADKNRKVYVYDTSGGLLGPGPPARLVQRASRRHGHQRHRRLDRRQQDRQGVPLRRSPPAGCRAPKMRPAASASIAAIRSQRHRHRWDLIVGRQRQHDGQVFKYSMSGRSGQLDDRLGQQDADRADDRSTNGSQDIWIVDSGTDKVYPYTAHVSRTSGSHSAAALRSGRGQHQPARHRGSAVGYRPAVRPTRVQLCRRHKLPRQRTPCCRA